MASRRLPLTWVIGATVLTLVVAMAVAALLTRSSASGGQQTDSDGNELPLTPVGEIPESVDDVLLAGFAGDDDRRLGELLGDTPIVLNFFASWCVPCIEEMPDFERVHQDLGDEVTWVGLAMMDSDDAAQALVERTGVTYPTYGDPNGDALTFFEGTAMPTTVFLSPDGDILEVHSRPLDQGELRDRIDDHFELATGTGSP